MKPMPDGSAILRAGFVLTGGASRRMGRNKALLPFGGGVLVQTIAEQVFRAAGNVTLIGGAQSLSGLPYAAVQDLQPGLGPLSGIHTALSTSSAELNLIVACDMPGLNAAFLTSLFEAAERSSALCVAAQEPDGVLEPLCAIYKCAALPLIEDAVAKSKRRLMDLLSALRAEPFPTSVPLLNCNTPQEWEKALNG